MKKYIFKKTAGVMIVASMLCATLTAGCGKATVTVFEDPEIKSYGVSVEGTNSNYKYVNVSSIANRDDESTIVYEEIKDIIDISMDYKDSDLVYSDGVGEPWVQLNEKVKVSIPYEKGMYIIASENGVAYDVPTKYKDGKYVFKTDTLGTFVISTASTGKKAPKKTKNVELAQQTITDERTGVKVSGMLPVDAKMEVSLYCMDDTESSDVFDWASTFEDVFPKTPELIEYAIDYNDETNIEDMINYDGWAEEEFVSLGGKITGSIYFVKDLEVLDFESDLTVTLPFDYRHSIEIGEISFEPGEATAVQYDYDKKEFVTLDVAPAENTEEGTFQFTTKPTANFFLGGKERINDFMDTYTNSSEE